MQRDYKVYLKDILLAIDKIEEYIGNFSFEELVKEKMRVDAVVRNLEIIGEAVKHIPNDIKKRYQFVDWKKISGLRDILIHEYFGVDLEILWDIVKNKLPALKENINRILESEKKRD